jgi:hypothetical protein
MRCCSTAAGAFPHGGSHVKQATAAPCTLAEREQRARGGVAGARPEAPLPRLLALPPHRLRRAHGFGATRLGGTESDRRAQPAAHLLGWRCPQVQLPLGRRRLQAAAPLRRTEAETPRGNLLVLIEQPVGASGLRRLWKPEAPTAAWKVPHKQPKGSRLWLADGSCIRLRPEHRNHLWSYDFIDDRMHDGRKYRMLKCDRRVHP